MTTEPHCYQRLIEISLSTFFHPVADVAYMTQPDPLPLPSQSSGIWLPDALNEFPRVGIKQYSIPALRPARSRGNQSLDVGK